MNHAIVERAQDYPFKSDTMNNEMTGQSWATRTMREPHPLGGFVPQYGT